MTEDEKAKLWETSDVRRAGWVPKGARRCNSPPGDEINHVLRGAIVVDAQGDVLALEYRWPVGSFGTQAADFQSAMPL